MFICGRTLVATRDDREELESGRSVQVADAAFPAAFVFGGPVGSRVDFIVHFRERRSQLVCGTFRFDAGELRASGSPGPARGRLSPEAWASPEAVVLSRPALESLPAVLEAPDFEAAFYPARGGRHRPYLLLCGDISGGLRVTRRGSKVEVGL